MGTLRDYIIDSDIDCVTISESWLTEEDEDNHIHIEGYSLTRLDRQVPGTGGGLITYVKDGLTSSTELSTHNCSNYDIEIMWTVISRTNMRRIVIANIYRPPSGLVPPALEIIKTAFNKIDSDKYPEIFLMGDFNIDYLRPNPDQTKLNNINIGLGTRQLIKDITRYNPNRDGNDSIIDLIVTNSEHIVAQGTKSVGGISDHELVFVTRKHIPTPKIPLSFIGRSYRLYNKNEFISSLKKLDWNNFWASDSPQNCWELFTASINHILDKNCKAKQFNFSQTKKPWLDGNLISLIKDKNDAIKRFKRTGSQDDYNIKQYLQNFSKQQNRLAEEAYHKKQINDNIKNPKEYWKAINKIVNPKPSNTSFNLVHHQTKIPVNPEDTANYINEYFANIGPKLAENLSEPWSYTCPSLNPEFIFKKINEEDFLKLAYKININKSSGVPLIKTRVLKDAMIGLSAHMTYIINLVIEKSSFPDSWKTATVTPLPKGGDASDVNNLRPISILPLPSKIMEKILHKQIMTYLKDFKILTENQDGFRPNRSTINSLTKFTNNVYRESNQGKGTTAIYLDFRKAFDTINHNILVLKLEKIGFKNDSKLLIDNYLTNRVQSTKANGKISDPHPIHCGVPQGSVLGPLLFIIYINDLGHILDNMNCQHYADDTVLYLPNNEDTPLVENAINSDLGKVDTWCKANKLSLNAKKTKIMQLGTKAHIKRMPRISVKLDNAPLAKAFTYRYLGITIDTNLDFKAHTKGLIRNINHKVYLFRRVRGKLTEESSEKVLRNMILPSIDYGDIIYSVTSKTVLEGLQYAFNRGLKTTYRNEEFHVVPSLRKLKVSRLQDRREMHLYTAAFDLSTNESWIDNRDIRTRAHDQKMLIVNRPKNPFYRKSLEFRVPTLWNSFTNETRSIADKDRFQRWNKKRFKDLLSAPTY